MAVAVMKTKAITNSVGIAIVIAVAVPGSAGIGRGGTGFCRLVAKKRFKQM